MELKLEPDCLADSQQLLSKAKKPATIMPASEGAADPITERIGALELSIIRHPGHEIALEALEECLERAKGLQGGRKLKARARLVYGPTGAGKTTLIEDFQQRHPDVETPDGDIRRVVVVEMPQPPTTKRALVAAIQHEFGYRAPARANANEIIDDIADKVARLGVLLIIIDEAHHIFEGDGVKSVTEFIKSLLNRIKCQIVLCGLDELAKVRDFGQLDRRLMADVVLSPYDWTQTAGRLEYLALLTRFETLMDLPQPSNLHEHDFAMRLYLATAGSIGILSKYLSRALELALRRKLPRVSKDLLAEIYASWHPVTGPPNTIDFAQELEIPEDASLESLAAELRAVRLDPERNPFLCSIPRCGVLWSERAAAGPDPVKPKSRIRGGKRKVRGLAH